MNESTLVALVVGIVQGVFEWLPISSEGNVAIVLTTLGASPTLAVSYALFLHLGTAVSVTVYYRDDVRTALAELSEWRDGLFGTNTTLVSFIGVATAASSVVGLVALVGLEAIVSEVTGGGFVALVGALLIVTGLVQRFSADRFLGNRESPNAADAVLVGAVQGLAILPGVSRSGVTTSALLLRGHDGTASFRLSFLLSVPASLLGGAVGLLAQGGLPGITATSAATALCSAAVVGYASIHLLMQIVRRISFWLVCVGLGALAVAGGLLVAVA